MKKLIWCLAIVALLVSCGDQASDKKSKDEVKKELLLKIGEVEATLYSAENDAMNMGEAQEIIELYKEYANQFPTQDSAAEYLFKAADVSLGLKKHLDADKLLDRIIRDYTNFNKIVEVYYLKAFIYDVHLNQKGKAQEAYRLVIDKFPHHKLADDASAAIKVLTMSDEDLIKMFEEKNKES